MTIPFSETLAWLLYPSCWLAALGPLWAETFTQDSLNVDLDFACSLWIPEIFILNSHFFHFFKFLLKKNFQKNCKENILLFLPSKIN